MIIINWKYQPATARFQRIWSLAQGLATNGEYIKMFFLLPNNGLKFEGDIQNFECIYLGEENKSKNKIICLLISIFRIIRSFKKGDKVLSESFFPILMLVSMVRGIRVFSECNEYPIVLYGRGILGKILINLYIKIQKRNSGIFVISHKLKDYFIQNGIDEKKIFIINMVVDVNRFDKVETTTTERYIAYCGTASNYKDGVDVLLKAFAIVTKSIDDVKLYIIGKTPFKEDKKENNSIIERYKLSSKVCMLGEISAKEMPQYLKNAEILALARPNNIQADYGFPTKLGEYLLSGNPTVLTNVGELSLFLEDEKSCLFAKPNNPEDIANKILWLLHHPKEAKEIGALGKEIALLSFNSNIEAKKILSAISDL